MIQGPQEVLAALDFISRNFDRSVLQSAYEIIQHGSAALPGEMVAAAVFLQNGDTSAHMAQMADAGHLMCFYTPREMGEVSPLAVCTVIECGKTSNFYSTRFGSFGPKETFARAKAYAKQRNVTVTQALQRVTVSEEIGRDMPGMAKASPRMSWRRIFRPDCVKNPCHPSGCLRIFALQGKKSTRQSIHAEILNRL